MPYKAQPEIAKNIMNQEAPETPAADRKQILRKSRGHGNKIVITAAATPEADAIVPPAEWPEAMYATMKTAAARTGPMSIGNHLRFC